MKKPKVTQILMIILIIVFFLSFIENLNAKTDDEVRIRTVMKEVQGEVSVVTPNYIGINYAKNKRKKIEYEIALTIDKDVRLVHKRLLKEIESGDIVRVKFEETTEEFKGLNNRGREVTKRRVSSRKEKVIIFFNPKLKYGTDIDTNVSEVGE